MFMTNGTAAIDCQQLSKRYSKGTGYALKDLTLQVQSGEVYGFLGPNGAGKSTTIRTLLNFLQPSGGSATVLGLDIVRDSVEVKSKIGYLAGEVALYPRMTGQQFLDYMSALQPLKNPAYLKELTRTFGAQLNKPVETLSKGNKQKLGVIQAFMHEPEVLILDEPTSGLDPLMQAAFYETVETAKKRGAAIFLSSHDLSEVKKMCDRIGFIKGGQLVAEKTISDLQESASHSFDITFSGHLPLKELRGLHDSKIVTLTNNAVNVYLKGSLTPLFKILASNSVVSFDKHEVNLEEEFMSLYEKEATE